MQYVNALSPPIAGEQVGLRGGVEGWGGNGHLLEAYSTKPTCKPQSTIWDLRRYAVAVVVVAAVAAAVAGRDNLIIIIIIINNKMCARPHDMPPPLYAARCSPASAHTRLTPAASSAPCAMNIHDRQAVACSGYDCGVVHVNYVGTWTANQSGLATLTFDLLTLKVVSESRVTWATSVPILIFLGLSVLELGPMYATDVR